MIRVLSFYQKGCMACEEQEPINREVEKSLGIHIQSVNPLEQRSYIDEYHLQVTPTTVIIRDGVAVERFEGVVHREQLEDALKRYL